MANRKTAFFAVCLTILALLGVAAGVRASEGLIRSVGGTVAPSEDPILGMTLDHSEARAHIEAIGRPGATGWIMIADRKSALPASRLMPVTMDAGGRWCGSLDLRPMLVLGLPLDLDVALVTEAANGGPRLSHKLHVELEFLDRTSPHVPASATSSTMHVSVPGVVGWQLPASWAYIPSVDPSRFAHFAVAPHGAEGVLPVH